jgi:hypothetical protein
MKKKTHLTSRKKRIFFTSFFELILLLCISKMISRAWEGVTITFLNHSKWRRIEKDLPKCFGHRIGQVYTIKVANQNQYFVTRQPKNNLIYDFKYQKHPKLVIRTTFTFYFFIPRLLFAESAKHRRVRWVQSTKKSFVPVLSFFWMCWFHLPQQLCLVRLLHSRCHKATRRICFKFAFI